MRTVRLGMIFLFAGSVLLLAEPAVRLEHVPGDSLDETMPQKVAFRFTLTVFLMPLADGEYVLTLSPYVPPGENGGVEVYAVTGTLLDQESDAEVTGFSATEPNTVEKVKLEARRIYRLELASMKDGLPVDHSAKVVFPRGMAVAIQATPENPAWVEGLTGVISVPSGSTEILCYGSPRLSLISPTHKRTDLSPAKAEADGIIKMPVDPGEDGQLWVVGNQTRGKVFFAGDVPPFINLNQADLLLPRAK